MDTEREGRVVTWIDRSTNARVRWASQAFFHRSILPAPSRACESLACVSMGGGSASGGGIHLSTKPATLIARTVERIFLPILIYGLLCTFTDHIGPWLLRQMDTDKLPLVIGILAYCRLVRLHGTLTDSRSVIGSSD